MPDADAAAPAKRRAPRWIALAVALAVLAFAAWWGSRPSQVSALILDRAGAALGLEITASGVSEYRLRGTPMLVLRDVVAREPGAAPLLTADRVHVSLPWATLRARGRDLTVRRIELDAPVLNIDAMQRWLAKRPPGERRMPTLIDGLHVRDGRIDGGDWRIAALDLDVPALYPDRPARVRLKARYVDAPLAVPVDLAIAIARPGALLAGAPTGVAARGRITVERPPQRVPATLTLSGPLSLVGSTLAVQPAHLGLSGTYQSEDTTLPFAFGAHGPLRLADGTLALAPAGVALRGDGALPDLDAYGSIGFGSALGIDVDGTLPAWPEAWPALPAPIGQSRSPLPFALAYDGALDFAAPIDLRLQRDATVFDARFRLPVVQAWLDAAPGGTPLPPLRGRLTTPALEIAGARLEGIEIDFEDESVAP
ncbi:AsmA family protein [Cognatilysobacter tabacisoli]|uniref:hypothetical protein n=1 Tax=Cognatilysobacter tabacisoli TaxID=2315424 RepID=UPI000E6B2C9A|nr:hypothetical protein [Lysobacter tabacisoli]